MITATEAKQIATPMALEEIENQIKQKAQYGMTDISFPIARWDPEFGPVLVEAGFVVRRGGTDDQVVIVEWK